MSAQDYERILRDTEKLTPDEQQRLAREIVDRLREREWQGKERPRWEDMEGTAPYPLCGEDAQEWVSRTRQEADDGRRVR